MKNSKSIIVGALIMVLLTTSVSFAAWYSFNFTQPGATTYTTEPFYNTGSPNLRLWVNSSGVRRTYTVELQYESLTYGWTTVNSWTGSIRAGDVLSTNLSWTNSQGRRGSFRYKLTFSTQSTFDGTVRYWN